MGTPSGELILMRNHLPQNGFIMWYRNKGLKGTLWELFKQWEHRSDRPKPNRKWRKPTNELRRRIS